MQPEYVSPILSFEIVVHEEQHKPIILTAALIDNLFQLVEAATTEDGLFNALKILMHTQ